MLNQFQLREIAEDLLIESLQPLTPGDVKQITATLPESDQGRVIGWRLIAR